MVRLFALATLVFGLMSAPALAGGAPLALDMKNVHQPASGLLTGGQLSSADLPKLKAAGYTTIVNLRLPTEVTKAADPAVAAKFNFPEAKEAAALGFSYVNIPVGGPSGLTKENALALDAVLNAAKGPVVLHCASGNRAGALLALRAYFGQHESKAAALDLGKKAGLTKLEPAVEAALDSAGKAR